MDINKKIRGIKKLINNGAIIDSVDVLILIQEIERLQKENLKFKNKIGDKNERK